MKLKNKKLLSILLGLEMTISFAGCEGLKKIIIPVKTALLILLVKLKLPKIYI